MTQGARVLAAALASAWVLLAAAVGVAAPADPRLEVQTGHLTYVNRLAFLGADALAASDSTGAVRIWDVGRGWSRLLSQRTQLSILEADPRGQWIASVDYAGKALRVQRTMDGGDITPPDVPAVSRLAISPDGRRVAVLTETGRLLNFDARSWRPLARAGAACVLADDDRPGDSYGNPDFVFTPDGRSLAAASGAGRVTWIDRDRGCALRRVTVDFKMASAQVTLSPRLDQLAIGGQDVLLVYRLDKPAAAPVSLPSTAGLRNMRFSADGARIFEAYAEGEVRVTRFDTLETKVWTTGEYPSALALTPGGAGVTAGLMSGRIRQLSTIGKADRDLASPLLHASALAPTPDGKGLIVRGPSDVVKIDLARATVGSLFPRAAPNTVFAVSPDGRLAWAAPQSGPTLVVSTGQVPAPALTPPAVNTGFWSGAPSPDRTHFAVSHNEELRLYDLSTGAFTVVGRLPHPATLVAFSPDGRWLAAVGDANALLFVELATGRQSHVAAPTERGAVFAFSEDSRRAAVGLDDGGVRLLSLSDLSEVRLKNVGAGKVTGLRFHPDGKRLAVGHDDGLTYLVDIDGDRTIARPFDRVAGAAADMAFLDAATLSVLGRSGEIRTWNIDDQTPLFSMLLTEGGGWVAVAPNGAFDSSDIERLSAVSWVMPDDALRPLPAEMFSRDYFEPRLIARTLACRAALTEKPDACRRAFQPTAGLAELNRVRPEVQFLDIRPGPRADTAVVRLGASPGRDATQARKRASDAYDLRLFRDGQLVGRCPGGAAAAPGRQDLGAWRASTHVPSSCPPFIVRLPSKGGDVRFSAYAFNEDRVKSATVQQVFAAKARQGAKPRAYVVSLGVDAYAGDGGRNLTFAVKDATAMSNALARLADYDVVSVVLTSEPGKTPTATRATLQAVLAVLAGDVSSRSRLPKVAGADQLQTATPDDLVVVTFSGHGYTTDDGAFYLLPAEAEPALAPTPSARAAYISALELSQWLEAVDAGQLALIIDACHSAASVAQPGFKPGPMGDRGLGQLAYDKAMRVLAASQADDVALESESLQQGLLTYALAREGLSRDAGGKLKADENQDGKLTLAEWLRYGEQRTPGVYDDIRTGRLIPAYVGKDPTLKSRDPTITGPLSQLVANQAQTPALFDFARTRPDEEPSLAW